MSGAVVTITDESITCTRSDGLVESVPLNELRAVLIETTDEGPWFDDVYWILVGQNGGCVVPSEAQNADALLERLQELPDFNNAVVIEAMTCTENQRFLCWEREK